MNRATSFGYGIRADFAKRDRSPPPNTYTLSSDFNAKSQKGKVFSFGICREAYAKVYIKANPMRDPALPGPGTYEVRETPGKEALKYTMRPKTTNIEQLNFSKVPGPGSYEVLPGISPRGNHFFSKFVSSCATTFNPPRSKRFCELCMTSYLYILAKEARLNPGPGHYPPTEATTKTGIYFVSKFKNSGCRRFGSEFRDTLSERGTFVSTPGPGTYRAPSEFGHYQAQDKYINEYARTDGTRKVRIKLSSKNGRNIASRRQSMTRSVATKGGINRSTSQPSFPAKGGQNSSALAESNASLQTQQKSSASP